MKPIIVLFKFFSILILNFSFVFVHAETMITRIGGETLFMSVGFNIITTQLGGEKFEEGWINICEESLDIPNVFEENLNVSLSSASELSLAKTGKSVYPYCDVDYKEKELKVKNVNPICENLSDKIIKVDIILLMGQSNMKGRGKLPLKQKVNPLIVNMNMTNDAWYPAVHPLHTDGIPDLIDGSGKAGVGPGLSFANAIIGKNITTCIALIPCAKGGAWIDLWMPTCDLYNETIRRAQKAIDYFSSHGYEVNIKAALWLQGESDAKEGRYQVYGNKLQTIVSSLRTDLEIPNLPFISATIGVFMEGIVEKYPYYNEINKTLLNAGTTIDYYRCVDARDLKGHRGDNIHYNTASQEEIGRRMAHSYLEMTK